MATIEDLNKDYTKEKNILDKYTAPGGLKDKIDQFQADLDLLAMNFKVKQAEMQYAESRNDKTTVAALKKDLEVLGKDILNQKMKLEKASVFLSKQQQIVDEKFAKLSKDPEIKKRLDSVLYKRYDRKKKQELDKKQQLEEILKIVNAHPTVQSYLKGIEGYEKSIRKCDKIIEKYKSTPPTTPKEQQELADATSEKAKSTKSLADRRSDLVDYFAKNHPEINKNILENLHSYGNISKQIAGCDKSISNYDKAMGSLGLDKDPNIIQPASPSPITPIPAEKPSWFRHPIQRIKYQINKRKAERATVPPITPPAANNNFLDTVKLSKEEYNAELVQKYLNEKYTENLHTAARQKDNDPNER